MRASVKQLVESGQLEFAEGGWVQNDEADVNFDSSINQITEGHHYLKRNFGVRPRFGWQIDPFGHSSMTPELFARMGFDAMVINRIHHQMKDRFKARQQMEFVWRPSQSLEEKAQILTHILHTHYSAPKGFDWEEYAQPISSANVKSRAEALVAELKHRASHYRSGNLLVPFGDDFKFKNANHQFSNMDMLIEEINNNRDDVRIQYGTLTEYFEAVQASKTEFPLFQGDFFPYADNEDAYWTGYYTTRPRLKQIARNTEATVRAAEAIHVLARASQTGVTSLSATYWADAFNSLENARRQCGLVQHHDGVTGTAKRHVMDDYIQRLEGGASDSLRIMAETAGLLLAKGSEAPSLSTSPITVTVAGDKATPLVLYNPLAWARRQYVSVFVSSREVEVVNAAGDPVRAQVNPYWEGGVSAREDSETAKFQLFFLAEVPALGMATYFVRAGSGDVAAVKSTTTVYRSTSGPGKVAKGAGVNGVQFETSLPTEMFISNGRYVIGFENGLMSYVNLIEGDETKSIKLEQQFLNYQGFGGAYIFRAMNPAAKYQHTPTAIREIKGQHVQEVQVIYGQILNTVRVYADESEDVRSVVEIAQSVVADRNQELVQRLVTSISNGKTFFTDNGLEMRRRTHNEMKAAPANYYPSLSTAFIRGEDDTQLTLLYSLPRGVTSLRPGELEVMLHRHLVQDDGRGLAEPINDDSRVDMPTWMLLGNAEALQGIRRRLSFYLGHPIHVLYGAHDGPMEAWGESFATRFEPIGGGFPDSVHLLNLMARDASSDDVVLRLGHVLESGDHPLWSRPVEVDLGSAFSSLFFSHIRETSLVVGEGLGGDNLEATRLQYLIKAELEDFGGDFNFTADRAENQNTDEEGVFISREALERARKAKLAAMEAAAKDLAMGGDEFAAPQGDVPGDVPGDAPGDAPQLGGPPEEDEQQPPRESEPPTNVYPPRDTLPPVGGLARKPAPLGANIGIGTEAPDGIARPLEAQPGDTPPPGRDPRANPGARKLFGVRQGHRRDDVGAAGVQPGARLTLGHASVDGAVVDGAGRRLGSSAGREPVGSAVAGEEKRTERAEAAAGALVAGGAGSRVWTGRRLLQAGARADGFVVPLYPMDIKTFLVELSKVQREVVPGGKAPSQPAPEPAESREAVVNMGLTQTGKPPQDRGTTTGVDQPEVTGDDKEGGFGDQHEKHGSHLMNEVWVMFIFWGVGIAVVLLVYLRLRYGGTDNSTPGKRHRRKAKHEYV